MRIALIVAAIGSFTSPPLANVGVALALVLALASGPMRARLGVVAAQPLGRAALILFAVMTLAMTWAAVPWPARLAAWWNWRTMLLIVLTAAAFDDWRWKERFCLALIGTASLGAIASFAMWPARVTFDPGFPGTLFRNHVTQSMALAVGVLLAAMLVAQPGRSDRLRWLLAAAALVCLANLVLITAGRSGQVALAVAAVSGAMLMLTGRRRWQAVLAVLVLAAGLTAASPALQQRFGKIAQEAPSLDCSSPEESSTALRLLLWRTTGALIRAHPWLGYGVGGFTPAFEGEVRSHVGGQPLVGWCARPVHDPHNQFLRVTVEAGVLGLVAFLGLIAGAARQPARQPYRGCALALLAAWCTTSLFNSHFQTFNEGHLIALLLGALLAPDHANEQPQDQAPASAPNTAKRTSS
ncbi:MAG TPA: O-antigen ligase family protein [Burkholderiaceae bacterium]|nr:O-antigen ligase family protein [Burkholderiaceae bacterium]